MLAVCLAYAISIKVFETRFPTVHAHTHPHHIPILPLMRNDVGNILFIAFAEKRKPNPPCSSCTRPLTAISARTHTHTHSHTNTPTSYTLAFSCALARRKPRTHAIARTHTHTSSVRARSAELMASNQKRSHEAFAYTHVCTHMAKWVGRRVKAPAAEATAAGACFASYLRKIIIM